MVSIILPNLNTPLPYLHARVASIIAQTYFKWECIVVDGFSDNGSWEYLQEVAAADQRFKTHQFKREGIYKAWNCGIALAKGTYVYIATSDDTMAPAFLEKMVHALDTYTECGIAHCCLTIIDENGSPSDKANWDEYYPGQYFKELLKKKHIRLAPHDGILHCGIKTVYTSITQLLIRKSVFEKVGDFLTTYGSIADFEWGMRSSLVCDVLHVPEYLATWRYYVGQATRDSLQREITTYHTLRFFIKHAFTANCAKNLLNCKAYDIPDLQSIYAAEEFRLKLYQQDSFLKKIIVYWHYLLQTPRIVAGYIGEKLFKRAGKDNVALIADKIAHYRLANNIKVL